MSNKEREEKSKKIRRELKKQYFRSLLPEEKKPTLIGVLFDIFLAGVGLLAMVLALIAIFTMLLMFM